MLWLLHWLPLPLLARLGRGLGAYVALMLAGARPTLVRGAVLGDGPGLWGGSGGPTSSSVVVLEPAASTPDPYALYEMSRDLRPRDYATLFARLAVGARETGVTRTAFGTFWSDDTPRPG